MIEKDLIEIYKENQFLLKTTNKELWFSINKPLDKVHYKKSFSILTAWNPNNKPANGEDNRKANNLLLDDLRAYEVLDSLGKYNDHQEKSFLVYDIELDQALKLGIKYNQYSIFYNDTKSLSYIECSTKKVLVSKELLIRQNY